MDKSLQLPLSPKKVTLVSLEPQKHNYFFSTPIETKVHNAPLLNRIQPEVVEIFKKQFS